MRLSFARWVVAGALAGFTVFAFFELRPQPLVAASGARAAAAPCPYRFIPAGRPAFRNPPTVSSRGSVVRTTLHVTFTDPSKISLGGCKLHIRSYNGQLVGPTLRARPGQTLLITLANDLPRESAAQAAAEIRQETSVAHVQTQPHAFNTTNLHTHGLHVSPVGHGDNVLLAIKPQTRFQYRIKIPRDHPAGTFWYHAHAHGSTAIQVGSAMAGALIVEDDPARLPPPLRALQPTEKTLVFQTILYDQQGEINDITAFFPDNAKPPYTCPQPGQGACTWLASKRRVTVNGQIVPVIRMRPGEVQRWRMVDASFRESITLRLQGHSLYELALDGIYLGRLDRWFPDQVVDLEPGYRSDVLVQASMKPGWYNLVDAAAPAGVSLRERAEDANIVARVHVVGTPRPMKLPTNAQLAGLAPFKRLDLRPKAVGVQAAVFTISTDLAKKNPGLYFHINYEAFTPTRVRYLQLGAVDRWDLTAVGAPHVFHIHVNPFQVVRKNPSGDPELVWKDTLLLPPRAAPTSVSARVYTQYTDFPGKFVMHCHILDHEDLGMMEVEDVVKKVPPPGATHGGSGHAHG